MNGTKSAHFRLHRGRLALFAAAVAPSSVWLDCSGALARPWEVAGWTLVCALAVSLVPGRRGARISAWAQLLALPLTIAWIGTAATTGAGPSITILGSAFNAFSGEFAASALAALSRPQFIAAASVTVGACLGAVMLTRSAPPRSGNLVSLLFVILLLPIGVTGIDRREVWNVASLEARSSVPLIAHLTLVKETASIFVDRAVLGQVDTLTWTRTATAAKTYTARSGLAVFVVGESLRADALLRDGRGPWSGALRERLAAGLGVRGADACACGNTTHISVPRLLTAVEVDDEAGAAKNPSILAICRAAGAKTAFIYNHLETVFNESGHDLIFRTSSQAMTPYDDAVVQVLADFAKRTGTGPRAAVLQLYGQHLSYADRYPQSAFGPEPAGLDQAALEELRYGRAAEYGVKVLLDLASVLDAQSEPSFMVFTSDHAENLRSDGAGKAYHAGGVPGINEVTVPVLILWNRAFAETGRAGEIRELVEARGLIAHRDVANAWLTLTGMSGRRGVSKKPLTWGLGASGKYSSLVCSELGP